MAELHKNTTIGGALAFSQENLPLFPNGNVLQYKDYKVYTEYSKPTSKELGVVNIAGDTLTGDLTINKTNGSYNIQSGNIKTTYSSSGISSNSPTLTISNSSGGLVMGSNSITTTFNGYFSNLFDNNKRVYSDNNKPTNIDLDLVSRKGDTLAGNYTLTTGQLKLNNNIKLLLNDAALYKSGTTLNIGSNSSGAAGVVTNLVLFGSKDGEVYYNDGIQYKIHHDKNQLDIGTTDATARSALKLGNASTHNYGTSSNTIAMGNDSRIVNAVQNTRKIIAGTGLNGTSDLKTDVTLSVKYGTAAGTAAQGNDSRIVGAASKVYTDAELAKKADKTITITAGKGLLGGGTLAANRTLSVDVGENDGQIMEVGAFGLGVNGYKSTTKSTDSDTFIDESVTVLNLSSGSDSSINYGSGPLFVGGSGSVLTHKWFIMGATQPRAFIKHRRGENSKISTEEFYTTYNLLNIGTTALSARSALQLGNSAQLNVGTAPGTVAAGNDSRIVNAASNSYVNTELGKKANNTITITAGTGLSGGGNLTANRTLNVVYGTAAGTAAQGNDSRIVNAASKTDLSNTSKDLENKIEEITKKLFPVGSCYTQYPNTPEPSVLFGGIWELMFADKGVFFRTEGGNAGSFDGTIQQDLFKAHNHTATTNTTGAHTHTATATSAGAHAHTASTNSTGAHTHPLSINGGGSHSHAITGAAVADKYGSLVRPAKGDIEGSGIRTGDDGWHSHTGTASSAGGHAHTVTVASGGAHTHPVSVSSEGNHAHTVSVANTGGVETRPINVTIRVWKRIS